MSDQTAKPSARQRQRDRVGARRRARADRRQTLFELIVSGHSYAAIALESGVSEKTLRREVDRAIAARPLDAPERFVQLQMARVEKALLAADEAIERGDVRAVSQYLKTLAALDRYHGVAAALAAPEPAPPAETPSLPAPAPPLALTHLAASEAPDASTALGTEKGA